MKLLNKWVYMLFLAHGRAILDFSNSWLLFRVSNKKFFCILFLTGGKPWLEHLSSKCLGFLATIHEARPSFSPNVSILLFYILIFFISHFTCLHLLPSSICVLSCSRVLFLFFICFLPNRYIPISYSTYSFSNEQHPLVSS